MRREGRGVCKCGTCVRHQHAMTRAEHVSNKCWGTVQIKNIFVLDTIQANLNTKPTLLLTLVMDPQVYGCGLVGAKKISNTTKDSFSVYMCI